MDVINCVEFFYQSVQGYRFCGGVEICISPQELKVAVNTVSTTVQTVIILNEKGVIQTSRLADV